MLHFRQLFDGMSSTFTYLLADGDTGEAVLIDPVFEQARRDAALIAEMGLTLVWTLETHVHADHVTAAWLLKSRLGSRIAVGAGADAGCADETLGDGDRVAFGQRHLSVRATPGHTGGCLTYVLDDESRAFTGDCLLVRGCGRTDFQGGDARTLYRSVHSRIFTLPAACRLYPAHDYRGISVTTVGEEVRFNPRLGGQVGEDDFVGFMANLGLAHPKQIDIAVPANRRCGRPEEEPPADAETAWAPLTYTFAGIWEIEPHWVEEHRGDLIVIDVREADEFDGPLGHIDGATLIPLGTLAERAAALPRDTPIVTVCRSGSRSAQATLILRKAGIDAAANLAGGMLRWRAEGGLVIGGRD
jgi:sulfur dioxygenase